MTREEAEEIIDLYECWELISCSCHINPPCSKCTDSPSPEEYEAAILIVSEETNLGS